MNKVQNIAGNIFDITMAALPTWLLAHYCQDLTAQMDHWAQLEIKKTEAELQFTSFILILEAYCFFLSGLTVTTVAMLRLPYPGWW